MSVELSVSGRGVQAALRSLDANVEAMAEHSRRTGTAAESAVQDTDKGARSGSGTAEGMSAIQNAAAANQLATAVQEVARTSEGLSQVAEGLRNIVTRFKL